MYLRLAPGDKQSRVQAQNIELRVKPRHGTAVTDVHTSLNHTQLFSEHVISFPDMYAEEQKDVIVDLMLPPAEDADGDSRFGAADITVTYLDVAANSSKHFTQVANLRRKAQLPANMQGHQDLALHRARLAAANGMRRAAQIADNGDAFRAIAMLQSEANTVENLIMREGSIMSEWTHDLDLDSDDDDEGTVRPGESAAAAATRRANTSSRRATVSAQRVASINRQGMLQALRSDLAHVSATMRDHSTWQSSGRMFASAQSRSHLSQRSAGPTSAPSVPLDTLYEPTSITASPQAGAGPAQGAPAAFAPERGVGRFRQSIMASAPVPMPTRAMGGSNMGSGHMSAAAPQADNPLARMAAEEHASGGNAGIGVQHRAKFQRSPPRRMATTYSNRMQSAMVEKSRSVTVPRRAATVAASGMYSSVVKPQAVQMGTEAVAAGAGIKPVVGAHGEMTADTEGQEGPGIKTEDKAPESDSKVDTHMDAQVSTSALAEAQG